MEFTPWTIFVDLGLISLLFLVGSLLRAKVKLIQELFLPAGLLAGLIALALGPNGLGWLPFSSQIGTYPGILIAVVFAALPFSSEKTPFSSVTKRVGSMWAYSQMVMIMQWGSGLLFALLLLNNLWGDLHTGFGLMLASGFAGGHGTAAAIGQAFAEHGWEDAASLAMTSATVGIISAIVGGLILIKWGAKKGHTGFISNFDQLPKELKTGLVPLEMRKSVGAGTVSSISIDPLMFHASLVGLAAMCGYYLSKAASAYFPKLNLPAFCLAFLVALLLSKLMQGFGADEYVDQKTMNRISGTCTDLLVAFGVASIKLPVVVKYALPLALLFVFGVVFCLFFFIWMAPRFFRQYWFERGIFTWGWATGTTAMGIALLRIVDPDLESKTLDDFALAYIPMAPVEIAIVTFAPLLIVNGQHWLFTAVTMLAGLIIFGIFRGKQKDQKLQTQNM
ncbi:sodium/glutamate symporter [Brevibacillus sp. B_LB10_24]|uniref:sodium/glutamate symporter n=1 Tax=Brevibacillus sp. B_LB10_24 TaxID=3380645 RepID=UPI0038BD6BBB